MLSRYRLIEKIGEGGMGVVWKAEDTTLHRHVALKFLTEESYAKPLHRARFLREARTAAALNHPHVCVIHEVAEVAVGEEGALGGKIRLEAGTPYIAMEWIEGRTLERVLRESDRPSLKWILDVAVRVAEALRAAHEKNIVHRDLKPANVMLVADDRVKILDFGLAKPLGPAEADDDVMTAAETASAELTRTGSVLGTVAYMSPEQARGAAVDSRSDIFSFGVMLYEMAAGRRPFRGESPTSTLAKILEAEPEPVDEARSDLPPDLVRIIRRCLRKQPDDRYNDTRDLVAALKDLRQETDSVKVRQATSGASVEAPAARARLAGLAPWVAALAIVAAIALAVAWYATRTPSVVSEGPVPVHRQITFTGKAKWPAVSPDGHYVAYTTTKDDGRQALVIQDLAGGRPLEIFEGQKLWAIWSPEGTKLLVHATTERPDGTSETGFFLVPRLGGTPTRLSHLAGQSWAPDGRRMVGAARASELVIVDMVTGETTPIPVRGDHVWMQEASWSPVADRILFKTRDDKDAVTVWTIAPDGTGQTEVLTSETWLWSLVWGPEGNAFYYMLDQGGTADLMRFPVHPRTGEPGGDPITVMSGINAGYSLSISADGRKLVYTRSSGQENLWLVEIPVSGGAAGGVETRQLTSGTVEDTRPNLSPDGKTLAFARDFGDRSEIFVMSLAGGEAKPLTFLRSASWSPVWSPDGKQIAFISDHQGEARIWLVDARGGTPRPFSADRPVQAVPGEIEWAPARSLLYQLPGNRNFHWLDPETGAESPLIEDDSVGWVFFPRVSPDGARVAVAWNRQDRGIWVLSTEDRTQLHVSDVWAFPCGWSADGEWIYALDYDHEPPRILAVPAEGGEARTVLELPFEDVSTVATMTPDGKSFVVTVREGRSDVWLVENFDPDAN
jgi:Tol biopolymer transport system component